MGSRQVQPASDGIGSYVEHDTYVSAPGRSGRVIRKRRAGSRTWAKLFIAFAAFHIAMTLIYLVSPPLGPMTTAVKAYMEPVFKQSWYVFAPDPVSRNSYLEVRARTADGKTTDWFNISRCDTTSAVLHHPIPNRRYITTFQLMRHYEIQRDALPDEALPVLQRDASTQERSSAVKKALDAAGAPERAHATFMKHDTAMNNFVSSVARARWGNDVKSVQMRIRSVHTVPFEQRNTDAQPKTETWQTGFVTAAPQRDGVDEHLADIYGPKAGC